MKAGNALILISVDGQLLGRTGIISSPTMTFGELREWVCAQTKNYIEEADRNVSYIDIAEHVFNAAVAHPHLQVLVASYATVLDGPDVIALALRNEAIMCRTISKKQAEET